MVVSEPQQCLGDLAHGALGVLHEAGFLHCDVRPENICFAEDFAVKFIDVDQAIHSTIMSDNQHYIVAAACMT